MPVVGVAACDRYLEGDSFVYAGRGQSLYQAFSYCRHDYPRGDRVMERLLIRLQQSPRCDNEMREDIARLRAFVEAAPPRKQRGNRKVLLQARALATIPVRAIDTAETVEPTAPETVAAETTAEPEIPTEPEVATTEATELCAYCREPGHSFNDCHRQSGRNREAV